MTGIKTRKSEIPVLKSPLSPKVQRSSIDTLVKRHDSNIVDVTNTAIKGEL